MKKDEMAIPFPEDFYDDYQEETEPTKEDYTCHGCISESYCEYRWDEFNLEGNCLAR